MSYRSNKRRSRRARFGYWVRRYDCGHHVRVPGKRRMHLWDWIHLGCCGPCPTCREVEP